MDQIDVAIDQINGANMLSSALPQFGVVVETPTRSLSVATGRSAADSKHSAMIPNERDGDATDALPPHSLSLSRPTRRASSPEGTMEAMGGEGEPRASYHNV